MKVITIKQPYASLIAAGIKQYEFRTWRTKYRGELLIHAGRNTDEDAMEKFKGYGLQYPKGVIIAKVNLTDCVEIDDSAREMLRQKNALVYSGVTEDENWKGWGFKLENVVPVEPLEVTGHLGLWELDEISVCRLEKGGDEQDAEAVDI